MGHSNTQYYKAGRFVRALEKLRKAAIYLVMSVCLSLRLGSHWMDFHEI